MSFFSTSLKRYATLALALAPIALTGCANMINSAPETNALSVAGTMVGSVHGGNSPVMGAAVKLYAAGTTGYGSAGTLLATTSSSNDNNASFSFTQVASGATGPTGNTYTCPTTSSLLYIIASGGNTVGTGTNNNAAAVYLAGVGPCGSTANQHINLNEVTSVASIWALQQYINPGNSTIASASVGSPNTTQAKLGLSNAFATIGNLVSISNNQTSGTAVVTNTLTGTASTVSGATVTVTPDAGKVNTIANVLAACINNASATATNCGTLFTNAVPPTAAFTSQPSATFGTAVDTLQAAYYMATNPTDGGTTAIANLYGLVTATSPFQPVVAAQPTDWTIGINFGSNSQPNAPNYLITEPEHVAIDSQGNVWTASFGSTSAGNSVTKFSPTGTPLVQALTTIYGTNRNMAIDQSDNLWVPISYGLVGSTVTSAKGTTLYEYTSAGATNIFTTGNDPGSVAIDGLGNAFVIEPGFGNTATASGAASVGTVEEVPAGSANGTLATTVATNIATDFSNIAVDSNATLWVTGGNNTTTPTPTGGVAGIYQFLKNSGTGTGYPTAPTATGVGTALAGDTTVSSLTAPEPLTINSNGDILSANFGKATIGGIAGTSTTNLVNAANVPITTTSVASPQFLTVDGAGNIWTSDAAASLTIGNVYEFSSTGVALSPTSATPTGGFTHTYKTPYQVAVDPSGNVWVGSSAAAASATAQAFFTEIVGAAVPVVTPIAAGLPAVAGGTNRLGTKP
jgi:hypothetical protein